MVFLITFVCYGRHLHGSESGSVDRGHNVLGSPLLEADSVRAEAERERMEQPAYSLGTSGTSGTVQERNPREFILSL